MKILLFLALSMLAQAAETERELNHQLFFAGINGDLLLAENALRNGADVNVETPERFTPVVWAALNNRIDIVNLFISAGADVNSRDPVNITILMMVAENGHLETVKRLLSLGVDVNAKSNSNQTALALAQSGGHLQIADLLQHVIAFLDNPLEQVKKHPELKKEYLVWSIAYKKDAAYDYLVAQHPDLMKSLKSLISYLLQAVRLGNAHGINSLKTLLKERKPEGVTFVCLKALKLLIQFHPELVYIVHQIIAEVIAPRKLAELTL